jgi:hypothetical protein
MRGLRKGRPHQVSRDHPDGLDRTDFESNPGGHSSLDYKQRLQQLFFPEGVASTEVDSIEPP